MARKLLLAGYYGFGNTGDEAILAGLRDILRSIGPDVELTVVSGNPERTRALHAVEAVLWTDVDGIVEAARRSDALVVGGGGLFHDYWEADPEDLLTPWHGGLSYVGEFPLLGRLLGKPCAIHAVGVGPLGTPRGREMTRQAFERSVHASVRDQGSIEGLKAAGYAGWEQVRLAADPAFHTPLANPEDVDQLLQSAWVPLDKPLVGACLRYWDFGVDQEAWEAEVSQSLDGFLDGFDGDLLLVPFQGERSTPYEDDVAVARRVWRGIRRRERAHILDVPPRPDLAAGLLARCDLVLAMRLHAAMFALMSGVPVVNLAYDPKTVALMSQAGAEEGVLYPEAWKAGEITDRLKRAHRQRDQWRPRLLRFREAGLESARRGVIDMLEGIQQRAGRQAAGDLAEITTFALRKVFLAIQQRGSILRLERDVEKLSGRLHSDESSLEELRAIKQGAGWRLLRLLWRIRTTVAPQGTLRERLLLGIARGGLGRAMARGLQALGFPRRMSWHAYAFDRFKRAWIASLPVSNVSGSRWPTRKGLVSIVLPAYNGAAMVRESLESVLAQTYPQWELIVIDDGSTDDTGHILDEYARRDRRIRVVHQENRKIPRSLSSGFRLAQGEFRTWTSVDNRMRPEFLSRMVDCLERHPSWDMVYGNVDIIGEDGEPLRGSNWYAGYQNPTGSEHIHLPPDPSELNTWANNYIGGAFLYRDRVSGLIGDYSPLRYTMEDYDYWMKVNALLQLRHADFDEPAYEYRFHSKSLTSRDEELGITRHRVRMMVFDDFRRDFYLAPLLWRLDGSPTPLAQRALSSLRTWIQGAGHSLVDQRKDSPQLLPRFWLPSVYVQCVSQPGEVGQPPTDVPPGTFMALVLAEAAGRRPPEHVDNAWDLCVTIGDTSVEPPRLAEPGRGWVAVVRPETLAALLTIKARVHHLERVESELEKEAENSVPLSVVVCTYWRADQLRLCLESVLRQRFPRKDYEIVVVNNDPADRETDRAVEALRAAHFAGHPDHLRLTHCPLVGLSHARNAGIAEARGRVICFLDDDAVADSDWLHWVWAAYEAHPEAGVIGGSIRLKIPEPAPSWLRTGWEGYWSGFVPGRSEYFEVDQWWQYPWGANWSARRTALLEMGGFRTRYGRKAEGYAGGEEIVAASLALKLGYRVAVEPRAVVDHWAGRERFTRRHVWNTIQSGARTWYRIQRDLYIPWEAGPLGMLMRAPRRLGKWLVGKYDRPFWILAAEIVSDVRALGWYLADVVRRHRRPIVLRRSPGS